LSESGYPGFEDLQDLIDHYMLYSVNMLGISKMLEEFKLS